MKKLCMIALVLVLVFGLVACGRKKNDMVDPTTTPTTLPTTVPTTESILPQTDPTSATNIPDPDVNGAVPDGTSVVDDMIGNTNTGDK